MKGTCYNCGSGTSQLEYVEVDGEKVKICKSCRKGDRDE